PNRVIAFVVVAAVAHVPLGERAAVVAEQDVGVFAATKLSDRPALPHPDGATDLSRAEPEIENKKGPRLREYATV
ncbi:MAG: hypothetical protein ACK56C_13705, partial [Alphaproteobacteria bacterium]